MCQCWKGDPNDRPTFADIVELFHEILQRTMHEVMDTSEGTEKLCGTTDGELVQAEEQTLMNAICTHFHNSTSSSSLRDRFLSPKETGDHYMEMNPACEMNLSSPTVENTLTIQNSSAFDVEYVNTPPQHSGLCEDNFENSTAFTPKQLMNYLGSVRERLESNSSNGVIVGRPKLSE